MHGKERQEENFCSTPCLPTFLIRLIILKILHPFWVARDWIRAIQNLCDDPNFDSEFPISRSLSTSRRRTDELGSRLERPIHFECKLNEPMHIGMRLLHPAAADHSVSISRQQVQRIFSFSLRSRAVLIVLLQTYLLKVPQDSGVGGRRFSGGGLLCWVDCTYRHLATDGAA